MRIAAAKVCLLAASLSAALPLTAGAQQTRDWPVHSMERPKPRAADPGPFAASLPAPSDAIVLFDGKSLDGWRTAEGNDPAPWRVVDGVIEIVPGSGGITSRREFGDIQLHIEWMAPSPPHGEGQDRANSGVFLMGRYEVQILDSYRNETYADGQAAALYGQHPPLVNASRPPGQWQTYDIIFRRPHFDAAGTLVRPARMTVFHNGVVVHDNAEVQGATVHQARARYTAHADRLPIHIQDHGAPVRFRNIWVREL
jgi:hypothetical protein